MSDRPDSWQKVAYKLAERVKNLDVCDNGHGDWPTGIAGGCPCCRDRAAYAAFVAKAGVDPFALADGPSISIDDFLASS